MVKGVVLIGKHVEMTAPLLRLWRKNQVRAHPATLKDLTAHLAAL